jgi:hypothetical protein
MIATLALGFLLYSATSYGTLGMWLSLVVSFWAALFGLVSVYASHMRRLTPDGNGAASTRSLDSESTADVPSGRR